MVKKCVSRMCDRLEPRGDGEGRLPHAVHARALPRAPCQGSDEAPPKGALAERSPKGERRAWPSSIPLPHSLFSSRAPPLLRREERVSEECLSSRACSRMLALYCAVRSSSRHGGKSQTEPHRDSGIPEPRGRSSSLASSEAQLQPGQVFPPQMSKNPSQVEGVLRLLLLSQCREL